MKKVIYLLMCTALMVGGTFATNNVVNTDNEFSMAELVKTAYAQSEENEPETYMAVTDFCEKTVRCYVSGTYTTKYEYGTKTICEIVEGGNPTCAETVCDAKDPTC